MKYKFIKMLEDARDLSICDGEIYAGGSYCGRYANRSLDYVPTEVSIRVGRLVKVDLIDAISALLDAELYSLVGSLSSEDDDRTVVDMVRKIQKQLKNL